MIDPLLKVPFWASGTQSKALAEAALTFWSRVEGWLTQAIDQVDITTCTSAALVYHARDRSITRLPGETEAVWRDRVHHALTVAIESGSRRGLEFILTTYGVERITIEERIAGEDWDIVLVSLDPDVISASSDVLDRVFREWGRVCRRYMLGHTIAPANYLGTAPMTAVTYTGIAE